MSDAEAKAIFDAMNRLRRERQSADRLSAALEETLTGISDSADELTGEHEEGDGCGLGGRSCTGHDAHRMVAALRAVLMLAGEARGCCYNGTTTPGAWENFDPAAVRGTILANLTGEADGG